MKLDFKTRKLKSSIIKVNRKVKNFPIGSVDLTVYGVSKSDGVCITGMKPSDNLSEYIVVNENTFAYNPYRINIGSIGLTPSNFNGVVSPAYVVFKTKDDLNSEFLFYYLKSALGLQLINWYGNRGGVRNALRYDSLQEIDIPDISLSQQLAALKILKRHGTKLSELTVQFTQQTEYLKQLRQSILQDAVSGRLSSAKKNAGVAGKDGDGKQLLQKIKAEKLKLGIKEKPLPPITAEEIPFELPKGWVWCRLGEVSIKITDGFHNTPVRVPKGYPYIQATHVKEERIDFDACYYVSEKDHKELWTKAYPQKGEILYVNIGAGCGTPAIIEIDFEFSFKNSAIIKQHSAIETKYLFYYLKSIRDKINKEIIQGGAQPYLSLKMINNLIFPLTPVSVQQSIIKQVEQLMAQCDALEKEITSQRQTAQNLMQAVLREAFEPQAKAHKISEEEGELRMAAEA